MSLPDRPVVDPPSRPAAVWWVVGPALLLTAAAALALAQPAAGALLGAAVVGLDALASRHRGAGLGVARPPAGPLAALLLATALGAAVSALPALSAPPGAGIVGGVALCYLLAGLGSQDGGWRGGAALLVGFGVMVAVVGLLGTDWSIVRVISLPGLDALYGALAHLQRRHEAFASLARLAGLGNPREVSGVLTLTLTFTVLGWRPIRPGRFRAALALAAALMAFGLGLGQSVSGLAGVLLAVALAGLAASPRRLRPAIGLAVGVGAIASIGAVWSLSGRGSELARAPALTGELLGEEHAIFGVAARLEIWERAWLMLRDHPYTGIGLGLFRPVMDAFYPGVALGPERHAHNLLLQAGVDLGVLGLLAFLWLWLAVALVVVGAWRAGRRAGTDGSAPAAVGGALVAYATFSAIDVVGLGSVAGLALWATLGLGAALGAAAPAAASGRAARAWSRVFAVGLVLLLLMALIEPLHRGGPHLNAGRLLAYRALLPGVAAPHEPSTEAAAADALRRALDDDPGNSGAWYLLGTLRGWAGDGRGGFAAIRSGVAADLATGLARFPLTAPLLRRSQGSDRDALLFAFRQWLTRYPDRAGPYAAAAAAVCSGSGNAEAARGLIERARAAGAQPDPLLRGALAALTRCPD